MIFRYTAQNVVHIDMQKIGVQHYVTNSLRVKNRSKFIHFFVSYDRSVASFKATFAQIATSCFVFKFP